MGVGATDRMRSRPGTGILLCMRFFERVETETRRNPHIEFSLAVLMLCGAVLFVVGTVRGEWLPAVAGALLHGLPAPWLWGRIKRSR